MAKHKSFTCTTKNNTRLYAIHEMDALGLAPAGNCVVKGDESTYYFERQTTRDRFSIEMVKAGIEIVSTDESIIED